MSDGRFLSAASKWTLFFCCHTDAAPARRSVAFSAFACGQRWGRMPVALSAKGMSPFRPVGAFVSVVVFSENDPQGSLKYPPIAFFTSALCDVIHITRKNAI